MFNSLEGTFKTKLYLQRSFIFGCCPFRLLSTLGSVLKLEVTRPPKLAACLSQSEVSVCSRSCTSAPFLPSEFPFK